MLMFRALRWLTLRLPVALAAALWPLRAATAPTTYGEPVEQVVARIRAGGDPHDGVVAVFAREVDARRPGDAVKFSALRDAVKIAAAIVSTRDMTVDLARGAKRLPDFDWNRYGIRPLFPGADPKSIEDPVARAAYQTALEQQEQAWRLTNREQQKIMESDYTVKCAGRVMALVEDPQQARAVVAEAIAGLPDPDWIKQHLRDQFLGASVPASPVAPSPVPPRVTDAPPAAAPRAIPSAPLSSAGVVPASDRPKPPPPQDAPPVSPPAETAWTRYLLWTLIVVLLGWGLSRFAGRK